MSDVLLACAVPWAGVSLELVSVDSASLVHLFALLLATVVTVVVNVTVVCTIAVAVAVIVTVMYALWTHAMTVIIAIDNVDMTRRPIISFCHITDGL